MSRPAQSESQGVFGRVVVAIVIVVAAGVAGGWLGSNRRVTKDVPPPPKKIEGLPVAVETPTPVERAKLTPPLYFYSSIQPGTDVEAVAGEVRMAAAAGVHDHILKMQFPWPDQGHDVSASLYPLDRIAQEDPDAAITLAISLNPPDTWFAQHPEAAAATGSPVKLPSVASQVWLDACKTALNQLLEQIDTTGRGDRIVGFLIGALEEERWIHTGDYDRSQPNTDAFREWLRVTYPDESLFRAAWGNEDLSFETAEIPPKPDTTDQSNVFFAYPGEQNHIDYLRFVSESTADAIANLAGHIHQTGKRYYRLLVPYGHSFELAANDSGHCALGLLLDGEIDGFVSPVSYRDRGLGGAGGYMGPVNSAAYHARQWVIVDDTRTGISRNSETGEIQTIEGLRTEDVLRVQRRNYAAALVNGLGLAWADPQGGGALFEPRIWGEFKTMRDVYEETWNAPEAPKPGEFISYLTPQQRVTLMVVVDEQSRFFQRCDAPLNDLLLTRARDAALRVGVPTQFCLLQDVLDGHAAPAAVYLFLNAFHLHEEDRQHLKNILLANGSAAIWLYAPGYLSEKPDVENIAATTGLKVMAFDGPAMAGSTYQLSGGRWMKKGEEFGESTRWQPLFYIDAPESKTLAKYRESEKPSVGVEFFEEGWASIFIAEPTVTDALLREILLILEQHVTFRRGPVNHSDVAYFGPNLLAVHASADGEHYVHFSEAYDLHDLLNPEAGWLNKIYIPIPMKLGDTRILHLKPAESDELPEEVPDEVVAGDASDTKSANSSK